MFTKKLALEERAYGLARDGGTASATQLSRRSLLLVAFAANFLLAVTLGAEDARACSCAGPSTPEEQLQTSDAVFSGEVLDARENPASAPPGLHLGPVTFDVGEVWKGVSEEQVVVLGYGGGGDCGIDFQEGERYLVYAAYGGQGEDATLTTGICQGTKLLMAAGDDLEALGPAVLELPETEEGPDESKIRDVLEAVSGGEDGLITIQEGPGIYSTYDPREKGKVPKKEKDAHDPGGGTETGENEDGGLPGTGGAGGATLLVLGAGALLVGGGLLVRKYLR